MVDSPESQDGELSEIEHMKTVLLPLLKELRSNYLDESPLVGISTGNAGPAKLKDHIWFFNVMSLLDGAVRQIKDPLYGEVTSFIEYLFNGYNNHNFRKWDPTAQNIAYANRILDKVIKYIEEEI